MRFGSLLNYELFIIVGIALSFGTLFKLLGFYDISSDWFWFIAGVGLIIEGTISLIKQNNFNKKYKILSKEEYDRISNK